MSVTRTHASSSRAQAPADALPAGGSPVERHARDESAERSASAHRTGGDDAPQEPTARRATVASRTAHPVAR